MANESVMKGHGFYSGHSAVQRTAAAAGYPMLQRAAAQIPLPPVEPVVIADMGCAGGRNENEPMREAITAIRRRNDQIPIMVIHTDLPENDWASLFALVENNTDSYLVGQSGVFAYAAARSLYRSLGPDRSLHLGWSGITVHWLSEMPVVARRTIYSNLTTGDERQALQEQSRRDWSGFLNERARELHDGGQLVIVGGASDANGASNAEGLFRMVDAQLHNMVNRGMLRRSEYEHIFYPTWNRTPGEFLDPLTGDGEFAGVFSVEEVVEDQTSDAVAFPQYEKDGDAHGFAAAYIDFVRAITEPSFFRWLEEDRSAAQRATVVEDFYEGLQQRIADDPVTATCHWRTVTLRLSRRSR